MADGGSDQRTTKLRVKEYRTPSASREHLSKLVNGLENFCDQYQRYTQTTSGGRKQLALEFEEAGTYHGYDPDDTGTEAVKKFRQYVREDESGSEGWIHVLRTWDTESPAQGERVSWAKGKYEHDQHACAVVNEADTLAQYAGRNSAREILRVVHIHEVGHLLGAEHSDGAQFHSSVGRLNSAMVFFYGTPLHIDKLRSDGVHVVSNPMDRYTHRCTDELEEPQASWRLSTKMVGCALSKCDETIREYWPKGGPTEPNESPKPVFTVSPSSPEMREDVTLDASRSRDPDGRVVKYEWSVEMGSDTLTSEESEQPTFDVSFPLPGPYTVTLTVTDNDGDSSTTVERVFVEE